MPLSKSNKLEPSKKGIFSKQDIEKISSRPFFRSLYKPFQFLEAKVETDFRNLDQLITAPKFDKFEHSFL